MMLRTRRKPEPGVVVLDFRPFRDAMCRLGAGVQKAIQTFSDAFDKRLQARRKVGGAGNQRSNDWQSGPCSGWLHASCPNPATTLCACTCHGGHLR